MGRAGTPKMPSKDIVFDNMRVFQKLITADVIETLKDHYKVDIIPRVEKKKKPEKGKAAEANAVPAKKQTAYIEVFARTVDKADEVIDVIKLLRKKLDRYERAAAKTYTKNQNIPKIDHLKPDPIYISMEKAAEVQEIIRPHLSPLNNKQQSGKKLFGDEKTLYTALSSLNKKFSIKNNEEFAVHKLKDHINNRLMNVEYQDVIGKVTETIANYEQTKLHDIHQYQKEVFSAFTAEERNHFVNDVRDAVEIKAKKSAKRTKPTLSDEQLDNIVLSSEEKQQLSWMVLRNIYETKLLKEEVKAVAQQHRPQIAPIVPDAEVANDTGPAWARVGFRAGKVSIAAKTEKQAEHIEALGKFPIVIARGAAGTGKTYLGIAMAAKRMDNGETKKIILTRPAVTAGEPFGFLPGGIKEKMDPYLIPLYDALEEIWGVEKLNKKMETREVEIAPLPFMRGRTFRNCDIVMDEAQNTTEDDMRLFLPRLGENVRVSINGDDAQTDLFRKAAYKKETGLGYVVRIVSDMTDIAHIIGYKSEDNVRGPLSKRLLMKMEELDENKVALQDVRTPVSLEMLQGNAANMNGQDKPALVLSKNGNGFDHS